MALKDKINEDIKTAMKAKDKETLESLRAVKSALLLAATEKGGGDELSEEAEIKLLSKLVKQRKESAALYKEQGRNDLAETEEKQAEVIERYLPQMMSEEEVEAQMKEIVAEVGASSPADMGKVMGLAMKRFQGKADGKLVSATAKRLLT